MTGIFKQLLRYNNIPMRTLARSFESVDIIRSQEEHIARFDGLSLPVMDVYDFTFRHVKNFVEGMRMNKRILIVR